jgi:hypothetical protein
MPRIQYTTTSNPIIAHNEHADIAWEAWIL